MTYLGEVVSASEGHTFLLDAMNVHQTFQPRGIFDLGKAWLVTVWYSYTFIVSARGGVSTDKDHASYTSTVEFATGTYYNLSMPIKVLIRGTDKFRLRN